MSDTLEKLRAELEKRGVLVDRLSTFMIGGGEQIVGEALLDYPDNAGWFNVVNPKRLLRIQERSGSGIIISFMLGDMDLVEGGRIHISPSAYYFWKEVGENSQINLSAMYLDYFNRKSNNKAKEAGIILPNEGLIKPR